MSFIEVQNLTKRFVETVTVLSDVSLQIERGDFVSIVGASGSGKSTLLTILGGIDKPTSGLVLLDGVNLAEQKEKELAVLRRTKVGFVFQFFNLAPYLTVQENIFLPIILGGKRQKDYQQKANELMDYLGIRAHQHKLPATLSGGEQQRVAIARALIFDPEVILLDEPTGNLDSRSGEEIMKLLSHINKERGTTIVQVTHSLQNAEFGNRIIRIQDGKIHDDTKMAPQEVPEAVPQETGESAVGE